MWCFVKEIVVCAPASVRGCRHSRQKKDLACAARPFWFSECPLGTKKCLGVVSYAARFRPLSTAWLSSSGVKGLGT
jgi:hypothetical protein